MSSLFVTGLVLAVLGITVRACLSDLRTMRIPNLYSALILGAFLLACLAAPGSFGRWWEPAGAFVLMFVVTFGMYCAGMVGGGDTKFASALAPWVGLKGMIVYLFYMAIVGGVLGIMAIIMRRKKPFQNPIEGSWVAQVQSGKSAVPYGIAIAVGAWASIFHTGFLHQRIDEVLKIIH